MSAVGLILATLSGAALGALYMALLWYSVRLLTKGGSVALFILGAAARAALVIGSLFLFFSLDRPLIDLAAALAGFIIIRQLAKTAAQRRPEEG